ncbi:SpaH/EbpB family LPXTG-anchored major pilin [Corynebacterium glaucum]|uniref:SpaH/EbpB family LPXTG-anchored major pilin n=1 Tax=Corynebacterium glaucum TaxID=187491 RepID=UPI002657F3EA|nr:SpaH/EbpB family LPXTG-anchored major pilin [Corynebacterium glaucum]
MAQTYSRKLATAVLAAGLVFGTTTGTPITQAPVAHADSARSATIFLHKRVGADTHGDPHVAGKESTNTPGTPLAGAEFTLRKLNLSLIDADGYIDDAAIAQAAELQTTADGVDVDKLNALGFDERVEPFIGTTNENGEITFQGLPFGVYLVEETGVPESEDGAYVPSAPFVVAVPMFDPEAEPYDAWIRQVHVYPKNTELKVTKTVKDAGVHPAMPDNRTFTYTVNAPVPLLPPQRELTELSVVDSYLAGEFVNGLKVEKAEIVREADGTEAVPNYEISGPTPLPSAIKESGKVVADTSRTITVTDKTVLSGLQPGDMLRVTLTGEVNPVQQKGQSTGVTDGEVSNYAHVTGKNQVFGKPGFDDRKFTTPTTHVESYIAAVRVTKHKAGTPDALLDGAAFDVFSVPGDKQCSDGDRSLIVKDFEATGGQAVINALHVEDYVDGKPATTPREHLTFCIQETKAPSGYVLDKTPREITGVTRNNAVQPTTVGELTFSAEVAVENAERPQLPLPQVGGVGVIGLVLAGLALLGGGAYAARRRGKY